MEKIKNFFLKLFGINNELTKEEEQEFLKKLFKKIREA